MYIEERLAIGTQIIRIITNDNVVALTEALRNKNQGVTIVDGQGAKGPVKLIFTIVKRTNKKEILELIHLQAPNAFYTIEDVKSLEHGIFTDNKNTTVLGRLFFSGARK